MVMELIVVTFIKIGGIYKTSVDALMQDKDKEELRRYGYILILAHCYTSLFVSLMF